MKTEIPYYTKYCDSDGVTHYAVHFYNRITGFVTMLKDYVFELA